MWKLCHPGLAFKPSLTSGFTREHVRLSKRQSTLVLDQTQTLLRSPREDPYVCAKMIAILLSIFSIFETIFVIFLSTYSVVEATWKKKIEREWLRLSGCDSESCQ